MNIKNNLESASILPNIIQNNLISTFEGISTTPNFDQSLNSFDAQKDYNDINYHYLKSKNSQITSNNFEQTNNNISQKIIRNIFPKFLHSVPHPFVCFFHIFWKFLAFFTYESGPWVFTTFSKNYFSHSYEDDSDYVYTFVITTIFLSFDFWTIKNVVGRILVGMRWSNYVNDEGKSQWIFEKSQDVGDNNSAQQLERFIFWSVLYIWEGIWVILLFNMLIQFEFFWLILCMLALSLSTANLIGYWKCSRDFQENASNWVGVDSFKFIMDKFIWRRLKGNFLS